MRKLGRRAVLASSVMGAASLAGCSGLYKNATGAVVIEDISVQPAANYVRDPTVGLESVIGVKIYNYGSSQTALDVTVGVDGEDVTTERVTAPANDARYWEYPHTFSEAGTHTITANDRSHEVSVVEGDDLTLNTDVTARAMAMTRESAARGRVTIGITAENPNERPVPFRPNLQVGDQQVTEIRPVHERDAYDDARVNAGRRRNYRATVTVPAKDLDVTLDGEQVAAVSLRPRDTPYPLGTPTRTGAWMPNGGVGLEPELVAQFPLQSPDGLEQVSGGWVTLQAVSRDRLYAKTRWETADGYRYSLVAMDRWSGEEQWHTVADRPAEVAVVGDTEYVRDGKRLEARRFDGTVRWDITVPAYQYPNRIDETVTYTLPTEDALYVGTGEGVKEIAPESGDVRRTLPGAVTAVSSDAVFTSGGRGPVFKFPMDEGTTPEWRTGPPTGSGDVAAVSDGCIFVSAAVGGRTPRDAKIKLFAFDVATGEQHWSVVASRPTDLGSAVVSPGISDLHVVDEKVMFASNQGLRFVDIQSGDLNETGFGPSLGLGKGVAHPTRVYGFGDSNDLNVASVVGPLAPGSAESSEPLRSTSIPDQSTLNLDGGSMLYGRGVLYLSTNGYVYGYSGALPDSG